MGLCGHLMVGSTPIYSVAVVGIKVKVMTPVLRTWIASIVNVCPMRKKHICLHHLTGQEEKT